MVILITLNYNQNLYTLSCINSILKSDYDNFKILLIDNGSSVSNFNDLLHQLRNINDERLILKRVENNLGYVGGVNYGIIEAGKLFPDYYLIMNNDTVIDKCAISALVSACMRYKDKAIVTGKVLWYDKPQLLQNTGVMFSKFNKNTKPVGLNVFDQGQYDNSAERDMIDDIFWLFPCKLIELNGLYSHDYWFNFEQADFAMRAKNKGFKLIYTPDAKIWHKAGVSIGGRINNPVKMYYSTQGSLIYYFKHFNPIIFAIVYLRTLGCLLKVALLFLLRKLSVHNVYAIFYGLTYFHKWIIQRNENDGRIPLRILSKNT